MYGLRTRTLLGIRINYLERKAGRTAALLIHGNSSCKEIFAEQLAMPLSLGLSLVVPDLPGHGASENSLTPARTYSFPGYSAVLGELMRQLGYESFHVLGWSLGGHIGLEMWTTNPAVRSLLITGTPPVSLDAAGIAAGFRWTATTALAGRQRFGSADAARYRRAMMGPGHDPLGHFGRMVARTDGNARRWMVANAYAGHGVDQLRCVAEVAKPLAIVQGRRDSFIRMEHFDRITYRNLWTGAPVFLNCGHAPHLQDCVAFNAAAREFFGRSI